MSLTDSDRARLELLKGSGSYKDKILPILIGLLIALGSAMTGLYLQDRSEWKAFMLQNSVSMKLLEVQYEVSREERKDLRERVQRLEETLRDRE